ncbi:hypothetical protein HX096_13450 [Empedobacter falsenii]|uniref:tetratricopeptide repeat protein n=1 Tax=Empedobacter falsenii TaxID=343874 RepID=UPI002576F158|nr:tetratricopeptide repeat protein [Empedobacter falsenii]MDM1548858.1 hypothetical protein [Empedobacter falsenii]
MSFLKKLFGITTTENNVTEKVLNEDSKVLVLFETANRIYAVGNYEKSLELIDQIIPLSKVNNWKHLAFKANVLEDLGKYQEAIANYSRAIEWSNNEPMVYALFHQIGFCYLSLGSNLKAEEFYTSAINLKPKHPNTKEIPDIEGMDGGVMLGVKLERMYNNRGNARKNLKKYKEALSDCEMALRIDSYYSNTYFLKGQILYEQGNVEDAIKFIKKASDLGHSNALNILKEINQKEALKMNSTINEDPDVVLKRALNAIDNGNYNDAIRLGNELLNNYNAPTGYYVLGIVYTIVEKYDLALKNCLETNKYFPDVTDNLNRIGVCYCSLGNIPQGLIYFKRGMQLGDANCRGNYNYWVNQL